MPATLQRMQTPSWDALTRNQHWLGFLFVLMLSFFTIVANYQNPQSLFWDENYHIASAQKYLNGTFFMEPHPPLGKLLIALGEKLVGANAQNDQFIGTDYAQNPPPGFSFTGYRLFPVLLAWMLAPVIYGIFLFLTGRAVWALLLSFLYVFDNALLVHLRSAMLDSSMLFFSGLTILGFLLVLRWKDVPRRFPGASLLFGAAFAAALTTKLFALILVFLVPAVLIALYPRWKQILTLVGYAGLSFGVVYIAVWQIHFSLATRINPVLPDQGYYQASETYKTFLQEGRTGSPLAFPVMLRDSLKFVSHYERGVPRLDLCKADENGSPFFLWPFGGRSINYRWETPDGFSYRYLYLQANPVVWFAGLLGIVLAATLLLSSFLVPTAHPFRQRFLLATFFVLYLAFMGAISRIDRVLYLYHYFLPLILSFFLLGLSFTELTNFGTWKLTEERKTALLLGFGACIFLSFQFYRPLTYYLPLTDEAVQRRSLLKIWELKCVHCPTDSPFVVTKTAS